MLRVKCRKDRVHDPWCRPESPGEYQFFVANALSVVQKYATTASTAMAANTGCIRNAMG